MVGLHFTLSMHGECGPNPIAPTKYDPVTRQVTGFSEVERRQEYLDKMTGEAEVLRPLVEACLDNDPLKRPSILDLSKKIKPLKVCIYVIVTMCIFATRGMLLNQVHAGLWPARARFLKIDPVRIIGMRACVCVCARGY